MRGYHLSTAAAADIEQIKNYLKQNARRKVAARVVRELYNGIRRIAKRPGIGHGREDLVGPKYRFYKV